MFLLILGRRRRSRVGGAMRYKSDDAGSPSGRRGMVILAEVPWAAGPSSSRAG